MKKTIYSEGFELPIDVWVEPNCRPDISAKKLGGKKDIYRITAGRRDELVESKYVLIRRDSLPSTSAKEASLEIFNNYFPNARENKELLLREIAAIISKYAEPTAWIPCSERMPESEQDVLAYYYCHKPVIARHSVKDNCWHIADSHFTNSTMAVTHWMPLPPAPGGTK